MIQTIRMILITLLFLIFTGCSAKQEPKPTKIKYEPINCNKINNIVAIKKRYNYIVKISDFDSLVLEYSKCYKINKVLNKLLKRGFYCERNKYIQR